MPRSLALPDTKLRLEYLGVCLKVCPARTDDIYIALNEAKVFAEPRVPPTIVAVRYNLSELRKLGWLVLDEMTAEERERFGDQLPQSKIWRLGGKKEELVRAFARQWLLVAVAGGTELVEAIEGLAGQVLEAAREAPEDRGAVGREEDGAPVVAGVAI